MPEGGPPVGADHEVRPETSAARGRGLVVVTFFTVGNGYDREVERLRESCRLHAVDLDACAVADRGSWLRNCARKPEFLAERLLHHAPRPILWLDADAAVRGSVAAAARWNCDIAVRRRHGREVLSGTVFLANTPASRALVDAWAEVCRDHPGRADQLCLGEALAGATDVAIRWLDPEWCFIFDLDRAENPEIAPLVEHFQASRRLKSRRAR